MEYFLENINMSTVPSGLLYEAALPLVDLVNYNGLVPNDTFRIDQLDFRLVYATLYGSAVNSTEMLPAPEIGLAPPTIAKAYKKQIV